MKTAGQDLLPPEKMHGVLFDALVFLGFLVFPVSVLETDRPVPDWSVSLLLLAAVLGQAAGAGLKSAFLARRRRPDPATNGSVAGRFLKLLLFLHFILMTVSILMALVTGGLYGGGAVGDAAGSDLWIAAALLVGGLTTAVVYRGGRAPLPGAQAAVRRPWIEFLADGLLWFSVMVLTRLFWGLVLAEIDPVRGIGLSERGIVLLLAMTLLFVAFYLPQRYLYLLEDYRSRWTWLQVWLAVTPAYLAILVG